MTCGIEDKSVEVDITMYSLEYAECIECGYLIAGG